jgi:hypothetical protein
MASREVGTISPAGGGLRGRNLLLHDEEEGTLELDKMRRIWNKEVPYLLKKPLINKQKTPRYFPGSI